MRLRMPEASIGLERQQDAVMAGVSHPECGAEEAFDVSVVSVCELGSRQRPR